MPGDFPLHQRRGSRRLSHENSPWIEVDLPYVRRLPESPCPSVSSLSRSGGFGCILATQAGSFFDARMITRDGARETKSPSSSPVD